MKILEFELLQNVPSYKEKKREKLVFDKRMGIREEQESDFSGASLEGGR